MQQLFDRALLATMIGQDALVGLLIQKGMISEDEMVEHIRKSRQRMADQLAKTSSDQPNPEPSEGNPA